jgi:hypothetical protein
MLKKIMYLLIICCTICALSSCEFSNIKDTIKDNLIKPEPIFLCMD